MLYETRWRCAQCGRDFPMKTTHVEVSETEIYHTVYDYNGRMRHKPRRCGPIQVTRVHLQERFVEWLVGEQA